MTPRSTAGLALVSLVLVGCGTATSTSAADDPGPTPSPSSTATPRATPTATPTAPPSVVSSSARPLDDFPLARGYPETNGDDGSPVEVTDESGLERLTFCGRPAWAPDAPSRPVDLAGTTYTGEAEYFSGRMLARYGGEGLAAKALATLRLAVDQCPEEEVGGTAQVYTGTDRAAGDEGFTIIHRYRGEYGFDTGLEVIDAVRVGDLLLLTSEYGEGGGSDQTIRSARRRVTDQTDDLVPELSEYAEPAPTEPPSGGA